MKCVSPKTGLSVWTLINKYKIQDQFSVTENSLTNSHDTKKLTCSHSSRKHQNAQEL